jgi:ubiquinone/menaquinone biosynthesis C-methylase UbiE
MANEELKQRQSVMWGSGNYQRITEKLLDIHERVIARLDPQPGDRWADLACGTGAVAELASERGAAVTGLDLAPALIEVAKQRAAERGLEIDYVVGDCEQTGFEDGAFDKVSSTFGIMFSPDHAASAAELGRVTRPGGRLALANWTPDGGVGTMFRMMGPFQPAPPPSSPLDWGNEERVRELLGDAFDLTIEEHVSSLTFESGEEFWQVFSSSFGPVKTLADSLDDDRREEFHQAWVDFFEQNYRTNGEVTHTRHYLLIEGTRR